MTKEQVLGMLRPLGSSESKAGMARFGINTSRALGISMYDLRAAARGIAKDHALAAELWGTGIHEAMMLASFIEEPEKVSERQMESWVREFDSWDLCDQVCSSLFDKTPFAYDKAIEWSGCHEEFVKRAGFTLMACLAVHDKGASDGRFMGFLPVIRRESCDERNFVRKAVNWALRQIGKRNIRLNREAIKTAKEIRKMDSKAARWIASDATRELESPAVKARLRVKVGKNKR